MKMLNRKNVILMISFALLMFECMTTLTFLDARSAVSTAESAVGLHYSNYLFFLGGYIVYAVLGHQLNAGNRKSLFIAFSLLYLLTIAISQAQTSVTVFFITSFLATSFLGFLGSIMYSLMAVNLAGSGFTGRLTAISQSLAMLLQYVAMKSNHVSLFLIVSGVVSLMLALYLKQCKEISFEHDSSKALNIGANKSLKKELIAAVVLILCLEFISAFNDGFYVRLFASGKIDLYGTIRLV